MAKYFYAGGKRHPLVPADDLLALDRDSACRAGLPQCSALPVVSSLPGGLAIVDVRGCEAGLKEQLQSSETARTVYRSGSALVVPLPEVRVEFEAGERDETMRAVGEASVPVEITSSSADRLALRPRSGKSEDALDLANFICERAHPAAASVRLLQVVPKPAPPRR